jgi:PAS domain S-box-containing protein
MSVTEYAQELHASKKQLDDIRHALDQASIVAVTDRRGRIVYVNEKFCEISGYTRAELLGQTHNLINSGRHPKGFFTRMWRTISSGKVWRGEICNRAKDGSIYWVHTTIVPFTGQDGAPKHYVSIRTDVTERKRAEEELAEARQQLTIQTLFAERLSALAALAGGIAHELHQPLSGIRVYAETMRELAKEDRLDQERVMRTMAKITAQVDRAASVIQHMRDFASDDAATTATERIPLASLVRGVLDLVGEQLKAHGIEVVLDFEAELDIMVNRVRMEQVLINLIGNAKDSLSEKKGVSPRKLELRGHADEDSVTLAISDTGTGVPENVRDRIFEPFVTSKGPDRGTGLGLSICHGILRDYGGQIVLADTSPEGTTFHLKFPRHP